MIKGFGKERVIHSPAKGILRNICHITDMVSKGQLLAKIETPEGTIVDVPASMDGLLRGLIRDGYPVTKGFKIADIDPRAEEYDNCFTISDKARCIAGGVLEALLYLKNNLSDQQEEPNVPICTHEKQKVETIYADYAATHITKPECVKDAVMNALALGNSGRGVNESSLDAARKIYEVRTKVDQFFDGYGAEQVVFTSGITESLNTVIKGSLNHGDHVITTFMEHNSVLRPLYEMERQGVCLTITSPDVGDIKQAITKDTKMIVMTHASNVTGEMFDIQSVGKLCREKGILFGLSTGRDVHSVKTLLTVWGISGLVDAIVGTGGAEIYDYQLNIDKSSYPLDGELIKDIIKHHEGMDLNFAIPYEGTLYAPKDDDYIRDLARDDRVPYKVVDFDVFLNEPRAKLIIVCAPDYMDKVIEKSKTFSNPNYKSASLKTASILYEYMDPRVSKTHGLQEVMAMHKIEMTDLCTFGDADNDYDMTLNAGVGVVMANGSEKTKSVADFITDDNNHDGIANFINKYIL